MAAETLKLPPDGRPPPKVYPRLNRRIGLLMWLSLAGGLAMLGGGAYEIYRAQQLRDQGQTAEGSLVDANKLNTGQGRTAYSVTLNYQPPGDPTTYQKQFSVSEQKYNEILQAGKADVTYSATDPTHSAVGRDIQPNYEPLAMGVGLLAVSGGIALYRRRQWKKVESYIYDQQ
ncbi:MAG: DUF3592 domain-containing protein [Pirellulales bacterium]